MGWMLDFEGRNCFSIMLTGEMKFAVKICHARSEMTESMKFESFRKWTEKWTTDLGNQKAEQKCVDAVWRSRHPIVDVIF